MSRMYPHSHPKLAAKNVERAALGLTLELKRMDAELRASDMGELTAAFHFYFANGDVERVPATPLEVLAFFQEAWVHHTAQAA
jgi:hypothetical protein